MSAWSGAYITTLTKYMKGAEDLTFRNRAELAMMKSRGRIKMNATGLDTEWKVLMAHPEVSAVEDGQSSDFSRNDLWKAAKVDFRQYVATDAITEMEILQNRGQEQIINRLADIGDNLTTAVRNKLCAELYTDGYASGNGNRLIGFDSFTGTGTTVVGDILAQASDTYGNLSTALANYGGTWSANLTTSPNAAVATDWPHGQSATPEYDFWTPKLWNWSSNAWGTGSVTFEDNCERVIREAWYGLTNAAGKEDMYDMLFLSSKLMASYSNKVAALRRIMVPHKESNDLGFTATLNQEGIAITSAFDVDANSGYFWNFDKVEMLVLGGDLYVVREDKDIKTDGRLFAVRSFCNLRYISPRFFSKMKNYAAS